MALVKAGKKPVTHGKTVPADYQVCSVLAGQISRNRGINMNIATAVDPVRAERIKELTAPLLLKWLETGILFQGSFDWLRFSSMGLFKHKVLASELFETVAAAFEEDVCQEKQKLYC